MSLFGSFKLFMKRVLSAVRGKLGKKDEKRLKNILTRTGKRNIVLARGLLSALNVKSAKKEDIETLAKILENGNKKIMDGKEPFVPKEKKELSDIFHKYHFSRKLTEWICAQQDSLLYETMSEAANEAIGKKKAESITPTKTKVVMGFSKEDKRKKQKI